MEGVFRPYSGDGGILEELMAQAAAHPEIAEFRVIGQTQQGKDIGAVRLTKGVEKAKDGKKPTTVYLGAQHAREWITPEMVRRLLDLYVTSYGTDERITDLVDDTELWFIPVANPDGYDFTFEEGQPALAQEPAGQQRGRRDHAASTASTSTATRPPAGATTTRDRRRTRRATRTADRRRPPSPRRRRWTSCSPTSRRSSS